MFSSRYFASTYFARRYFPSGVVSAIVIVSREVELLLALRRLRAVLQGINGSAGGYTYTIKPASVRLDPLNLLDTHETARPLVALELTDGGERTFQPADMLEDERLVIISALLDVPGQRADRRITAGLRLAADLERAIASDLTLGGLAVSVRARQPEVLMAHQTSAAVIVQMPVILQLYRPYGRPEGSA